MWVKVIKPFGSALVGDLLEVKDDGQHQLLIDKGLLEKADAPKAEDPNPVTTDSYSTETVLEGINEPAKAKPGPKKKEDK